MRFSEWAPQMAAQPGMGRQPACPFLLCTPGRPPVSSLPRKNTPSEMGRCPFPSRTWPASASPCVKIWRCRRPEDASLCHTSVASAGKFGPAPHAASPRARGPLREPNKPLRKEPEGKPATLQSAACLASQGWAFLVRNLRPRAGMGVGNANGAEIRRAS